MPHQVFIICFPFLVLPFPFSFYHPPSLFIIPFLFHNNLHFDIALLSVGLSADLDHFFLNQTLASLNISGSCGEREWRCRDRHYCVHQVVIVIISSMPYMSSSRRAPGLAVRRGPGLPGRERRGGGAVRERL